MKNVFITALSATFTIACGTSGVPTSEQPLVVLTCPQGQVPWDFQKFSNGTTDESLAQLGIDAGTGDIIGDENYLILQKYECFNATTRSYDDITSAMRPFCTSTTRTQCLNTNAAWVASDRACPPGRQPRVTYTCASDQQVRTEDTGFAYIRCPSQPIQRTTECVPENCWGRTRRDAKLLCVPDLIKPVESKATLTVNFDSIERPLQDPARPSPDAYTRPAGASLITFDNDQLYRFKGTVEVASGPAPRQLLSLWVKSSVPRPGSTVSNLDIFRCFIGRIDLRKYTPETRTNGSSVVAFDEELRIPTECQDGKYLSNAIKTGWLANGLTPTDTTPAAGSSTLMASYDLEARSILTPPDTSIENTCVTRPIDFFYNFTTRVHNSYDYYAQNLIPVSHRRRAPGETPRVAFNAVPATLIAATEVNVPVLEYKVNKAGRARGSIDANVTLAISGPDAILWSQYIAGHGKWTYGMRTWANQLFRDEYPEPSRGIDFRTVWAGQRTISVDSYDRFNERRATGLFPVPDPLVKDDSGQPAIDPAGLIRLPPSSLDVTLEGTISESGVGVTMKVPINNDLRRALFNPAGRYPLRSGETRNYVLQVCTVAKVYQRFDIFYRYFSNTQGTEFRDVRYTKRLRVAPSASEYDQGIIGEDAATSLSLATNNCARSAVFSIKGENIVTPLPEVDVGDGDSSELNPTASGEPDKLSGTLNSDLVQDCVGARCETTTEQSFGGSTNPVKSTILSVVNEESGEGDTDNQFSTSFKMFGFDVLEAVENGSVGPVETTINVSPNYEAIARAFGKPYPGFKIEGGRVAAGVNGLSVGFEYKVPIHFGPIQGDLIFGFSAGAGIGVEVKHTYNPNVETSCGTIGPGGIMSGCPDPVIAIPALPFREARDRCFLMGGRLTEPRSDAVGTAMRSVIAASEEVWVGAQVGNEYKDNTDCAANWNSSVCANGHKTYLRWLSDAENFRVASSFGGFTNTGTAPVTSLNGNTLSVSTLEASAPVDSAVSLQNSTFQVRPMSRALPSLCKRPLISSGKSHQVSIALNVAAGAGFSVAFCSPSDEFGICLEGAVNLIEAKLTPEVAVTHTMLRNNAGLSATQTKFGAKVGWSVSLLSGSLEIKFVTPFGGIGYVLLDYEGFKVAEGLLANFEYDFSNVPGGF